MRATAIASTAASVSATSLVSQTPAARSSANDRRGRQSRRLGPAPGRSRLARGRCGSRPSRRASPPLRLPQQRLAATKAQASPSRASVALTLAPLTQRAPTSAGGGATAPAALSARGRPGHACNVRGRVRCALQHGGSSSGNQESKQQPRRPPNFGGVAIVACCRH